jgi:uncharacterized protein (DUF488 family)
MKNLFTIGYANYSLEDFVDILKKQAIDAVADVRSQPYSRYKPEFNREILRTSLNKANIKYVFLGELLGARAPDDDYYINDRADYDRIIKSDFFQKGLDRLRNGLQEYTIVLLCAEVDPLNCHRDILICKALRSDNLTILHIVSGNQVETNQESEMRLLKQFNLEINDLFSNKEELIEEAYRRQSRQIAYSKQLVGDIDG